MTVAAPAGVAPSHAPHRWTGLIGRGLGLYVSRRARLLADEAYWRRGSAIHQHRELGSLLTRASKTSYGRGHDFARIAAIDDPAERLRAYRAAVPVRDWYAFKDEIARMREGAEPDVLWPGLVRRFAQTSGTTAGDKFIPVSDDMMRSNKRASYDIFAYLRARGVDAAGIMDGRCLFLGGSSDLRPNEHGIITADLSGLVAPMIRWPLSAIYSPGRAIALESHWPTKLERMSELTATQDIRFISGMPSWALVLMERVLERTGARTIREVWPHLQVFVHGGVNYEPFRARVARVFSGDPDVDIPHRHELYPASEAFVAMQDRAGEPGMRLLADNGVFFEFVPVESIDEPDPPAFACHEVEPGQRYVVVLSTCAGLWRYVLGDVVEFDDIPAGFAGAGGTGPCRLRIVGRHRHFLNAFGENLIAEHIEIGVARAAEQTGLVVGEFTAAPVYPDGQRRAGLELVIELDGGPDERTIAGFAEAFDAAVKAVNVDYTTKRSDDLGMAPPTVSVVRPGAFHAWMASRGKLGGQHKCPRCANHREFVEGVLQAAQPN